MEEIRVGSHILQPHRQLLLDGEHVHLGPRALTILTVLAEADGEIVTKNELMEAVWPDVTVEENALQVHVAALRKALGEDSVRMHTLRGIGYQLEIGEVRAKAEATALSDERPRAPTSATRRPVVLVKALGALLAFTALIYLFVANLFANEALQSEVPQSLAVLPLQVSGDEDFAARSEALTASIAGNLARVPNIELASETATRTVAGQGLSPPEIGEHLGIDHMIEIDVLAAEQQLTAQMRLLEARTSRVVWTGEVSCERQYAGEFEALILNRISGILLALQSISNGTIEVPENVDERARKAFIEGLALMTNATPEDYPRAMRQMQLAASIDPEFASAHAGIAYAMGVGTNFAFNVPFEDYDTIQVASIERALRLDPDNFLGQAARGRHSLTTRGDIETGLRIAEELLERRPNSHIAHALMALAERYAGRYQAAINHIDRAIVADPFNYGKQWHRRRILVEMGDYLGVVESARACRIDCWRAAIDWWEALSRYGDRFRFYNDVDEVAALFENERAYATGTQSRGESITGHLRFLYLGEPNPFMEGFSNDGGGAYGIDIWTLYVFKYGYVDAGFSIALSNAGFAPASEIITFLMDDRMSPSPGIRADPRYHEIFEIPRFKAVADYRREQGLTDGLPVFPVRPFVED